MTTENRRQAVIDYVRHEARGYARGQISRFSSNADLAQKFEYKTGGIDTITRLPTVKQIREAAKELRRDLPFPQELESAWLFGYLSAGAHMKRTRRNSSVIEVSESSPERKQKFKSIIETYSSSNVKEYLHRRREKVYVELKLFDAELMRRLGDLSQENAPTTISKKYPWLLQSDKLLWAFLEGVFEAKGYVGDHYVLFHASSIEFVNFLKNALVQLGVNKSSTIYEDHETGALKGVAVYGKDFLRKIVNNIASVDPLTQKRLKSIINPKSETAKSERNIQAQNSIQRIGEVEWIDSEGELTNRNSTRFAAYKLN